MKVFSPYIIVSVMTGLAFTVFGQGRIKLQDELAEHLATNCISKGSARLWWHPDETLIKQNLAFERERQLSQGSVVRMLADGLEVEVSRTSVTNTAMVSRLLDAILRSVPPPTNLLEKALFSSADWSRPLVMEACVLLETSTDEGAALVKALVKNMSSERRAECYAMLGKRLEAVYLLPYSKRNSHILSQGVRFMLTAIRIDPSAECIMALDMALDKPLPTWKDWNVRKRIAEKYKDSDGKVGEYFGKLAMTLGPPPTLSWTNVEPLLFPHPIDNVDGDWEAECDSLQQGINRQIAFDFGVSTREVLRLAEKKMDELAHAERLTPKDANLLGLLSGVLWHSRDAGSSEFLLNLLKSPGHQDVIWIIHTYLRVAGPDQFMPMIRRVKKEFPQLNPIRLFPRCWVIAAEYAGSNQEKTLVQQEIIGFLRQQIHDVPVQGRSLLDKCLLRCDPLWESSTDRKRLFGHTTP